MSNIIEFSKFICTYSSTKFKYIIYILKNEQFQSFDERIIYREFRKPYECRFEEATLIPLVALPINNAEEKEVFSPVKYQIFILFSK